MAAIRFHWDILGKDSKQTAEHFEKHLHEFCATEGIEGQRTWIAEFPMRCVATLECDGKHLVLVRDRLKPVRAEQVHD